MDGFRLPPLRLESTETIRTRGFFVFFGLADLEEAIADVSRPGGAAEAPSEEPGFGRFCICRDPQGLRFGLSRRSRKMGVQMLTA
jgi:predicted enzyme related to lactoylglutathione lyase